MDTKKPNVTSADYSPQVLITQRGMHCLAVFQNVPVYANIGNGMEVLHKAEISLAAFDPVLLMWRTPNGSYETISDTLYPLVGSRRA